VQDIVHSFVELAGSVAYTDPFEDPNLSHGDNNGDRANVFSFQMREPSVTETVSAATTQSTNKVKERRRRSGTALGAGGSICVGVASSPGGAFEVGAPLLRVPQIALTAQQGERAAVPVPVSAPVSAIVPTIVPTPALSSVEPAPAPAPTKAVGAATHPGPSALDHPPQRQAISSQGSSRVFIVKGTVRYAGAKWA
jgi:hypothetical protein